MGGPCHTLSLLRCLPGRSVGAPVTGCCSLRNRKAFHSQDGGAVWLSTAYALCSLPALLWGPGWGCQALGRKEASSPQARHPTLPLWKAPEQQLILEPRRRGPQTPPGQEACSVVSSCPLALVGPTGQDSVLEKRHFEQGASREPEGPHSRNFLAVYFLARASISASLGFLTWEQGTIKTIGWVHGICLVDYQRGGLLPPP